MLEVEVAATDGERSSNASQDHSPDYPPVNRHGSPASVRMPVYGVTSALALQGKAVTLEKPDNLTGGELWEARGHTSTRIVEALTSS